MAQDVVKVVSLTHRPLLWTRWRTRGFRELQRLSLLAEELSASQTEMCSIMLLSVSHWRHVSVHFRQTLHNTHRTCITVHITVHITVDITVHITGRHYGAHYCTHYGTHYSTHYGRHFGTHFANISDYKEQAVAQLRYRAEGNGFVYRWDRPHYGLGIDSASNRNEY